MRGGFDLEYKAVKLAGDSVSDTEVTKVLNEHNQDGWVLDNWKCSVVSHPDGSGRSALFPRYETVWLIFVRERYQEETENVPAFPYLSG